MNQLSDDDNQPECVMDEFPDVFPDDLLGIPPDRDIEFIIDLLPGTMLIAKCPHRMGADELEELKKQLKGVAGQRFHTPQFISLGCTCDLC
jgi:hypothetical protein